MGYRDDTTALQSQVEILEREVGPLRQQLGELRSREEQLRRTIAKKKLRIRLHRAGKWIVGHPKLSAVVVLVVAVVGVILIRSYLERRRHQAEIERALLACINPATLQVRASFQARVFIGRLEVGETPQRLSICPGTYRVRVIHARALPWQQVVTVRAQQERRVQANLIPWRPSERPPGLLFFSVPEGALLFVNGKEVGRTPVFLREPELVSPEQLLLGLAARGHRPHVWTVLRPDLGKPVWLHLARAPRQQRGWP